MKYLSLALGLAASTWACSGTPTAPSPPPVPTRPTSSLSGLVFAVTVCGDAACRFYNGDRFALSASKDGYQTAGREVTINGDTQLDIQLVRR